MARTHPPYPPAFRAEAVELARASGKGIPQLAQDLGISVLPAAIGRPDGPA